MTRRSQHESQQSQKPEAKFPALQNFFSAYLHQDFRDEYGSASEAATAFCRDASPQELVATRREWKKWKGLLKEASADQAAQAIRKLGGAWQPQGLADLDVVERSLFAPQKG